MFSSIEGILDFFKDPEVFSKLLHYFQNPQDLVAVAGYVGLFIIIFLETSVPFGVFLPGDSLLFAAGFMTATIVDMNIFILIITLIAAAIIGDNVGYKIGYSFGNVLYERKDSWYFKKKYLLATQAFYEKYGKKTIVLSRFLPAVRTFAPMTAGIARMHYLTFLSYNVIGAIVWVTSLTGVGYFFGKQFPQIQEYFHWVIALIIFLSFLPGIIKLLGHFLSSHRKATHLDS